MHDIIFPPLIDHGDGLYAKILHSKGIVSRLIPLPHILKVALPRRFHHLPPTLHFRRIHISLSNHSLCFYVFYVACITGHLPFMNCHIWYRLRFNYLIQSLFILDNIRYVACISIYFVFGELFRLFLYIRFAPISCVANNIVFYVSILSILKILFSPKKLAAVADDWTDNRFFLIQISFGFVSFHLHWWVRVITHYLKKQLFSI